LKSGGHFLIVIGLTTLTKTLTVTDPHDNQLETNVVYALQGNWSTGESHYQGELSLGNGRGRWCRV